MAPPCPEKHHLQIINLHETKEMVLDLKKTKNKPSAHSALVANEQTVERVQYRSSNTRARLLTNKLTFECHFDAVCNKSASMSFESSAWSMLFGLYLSVSGTNTSSRLCGNVKGAKPKPAQFLVTQKLICHSHRLWGTISHPLTRSAAELSVTLSGDFVSYQTADEVQTLLAASGVI